MPDFLPFDGRALPLPTFFPSVSSVKMNFSPREYIQLLVAAEESQFLVSAYDIANASEEEQSKISDLMALARSKGASILMDSGNYEAYWHRDRSWVPRRFWNVLNNNLTAFAFSFDDQSPSSDLRISTEKALSDLNADRVGSDSVSIAPILHGTAKDLPDRVREFARTTQPLMLAVAERELGGGIFARARTTKIIRSVLDEVAPSCTLHVLGTGNPLSILMLSIAGANSFDGLEWCQTVADPDTSRLLHFQHLELVRNLVKNERIAADGYAAVTLLHNLRFYAQWMQCVREAISNGTALTLLSDRTSNEVADRLQFAMK